MPLIGERYIHRVGRTARKGYVGEAITICDDKERLLIDLIKNSDKIPFDYYKEIINNYREISNKLDINKISDYLCYYKHDLDLFIQIQKEVFILMGNN